MALRVDDDAGSGAGSEEEPAAAVFAADGFDRHDARGDSRDRLADGLFLLTPEGILRRCDGRGRDQA